MMMHLQHLIAFDAFAGEPAAACLALSSPWEQGTAPVWLQGQPGDRFAGALTFCPYCSNSELVKISGSC